MSQYSPAYMHFSPSMSTHSEHYAHHPQPQMSGLASLSTASEYMQMHEQNMRQPSLAHKPQQHQFAADEDHANRMDRKSSVPSDKLTRQGSNGPVRRRISRACDSCNSLRTKV